MIDFLQLVAAAKEKVSTCDWHRVTPCLQDPNTGLVIDVREDREWLAGTISGCIHLSKGILELKIMQHTKDAQRPIFLFCGSGYRSVLAAQALMNMGFQQVFSIDGGIKAWPGSLAQP